MGSSPTLPRGLLAIYGPHALHTAGQLLNPSPHASCIVSYQLVLVNLPSVGFVALVVKARVIPPPISTLLLLLFIQQLGHGGLLSPARSIFFV